MLQLEVSSIILRLRDFIKLSANGIAKGENTQMR